jgi:hypothetical protein
MTPGVKQVQPLSDFKLLLVFENDEERIFDVAPYMNMGLFRALGDASMFNTVRLAFDSIEWANGVDICPETLYRDSVPADVSSLT